MILLLFLIAIGFAQILPFQDKSFAQILKKQFVYIVYVHSDSNQSLRKQYEKYCRDMTICRELSKTEQLYGQVSQFINYDQDEYFFIIDASRYKKYVLRVEESTSHDQISEFYQKYKDDTLEPYYSSEQTPQTIDQKFIQLTGNTYQSFLMGQHPIKIVYLYSKDPSCYHCKLILQKFKKIAYKYYDSNPGTASFGYFDILLNDSKYIRDEIMPYFLIYVGDMDEPMGYEPQDLSQFQQMLKYMIKQESSKREKRKQDISLVQDL